MLKLHCETDPAMLGSDGFKSWWLNGKNVGVEAIVDLWLSRGIFCFYDSETQSLLFDV